MMGFSGISEADEELRRLLHALDLEESPASCERMHADVKEEPVRRGERGEVLPGPADLDAVARFLHAELACMANTPGGGAIVLGVADDGTRTGATVAAEPLRHRVYELARRRLTPDIREHFLADGTRVLICSVFQTIEPLRVNDRIHWRVDTNCVEVDLTTWAGKLGILGGDWSTQPSERSVVDVEPGALGELRRLLRDSGDPQSTELARAEDRELLRRIPNLVLGGDRLTNAGRLLLTENPVAIDYVHRPRPGADSTVRIEQPGPLLVQLRAVTEAIVARIDTVHVETPQGVTVGQFPTLPERAAREALMNGLLHRDWQAPYPTRVEHVGSTLTVESPGGLIGSVTPANIITHPSTPRHRGLVEAAGKIRLVEREGVGVDRMYADLISLGRPAPLIDEVPGPAVRVKLIGGDPDAAWVRLRLAVEPAGLSDDLNIILALDHVSRGGWVSASTLAPVIQDQQPVAADTLQRLSGARIGNGQPVIVRVSGRPAAMSPMYRLSDPARAMLPIRTRQVLAPDSRVGLLIGYARDGGRISSTEASDLLGVGPAPAGDVLKQAMSDGLLEPSSPVRAGRGFHYLPTG
jgi:ATP-dependent DNA helicase RecG